MVGNPVGAGLGAGGFDQDALLEGDGDGDAFAGAQRARQGEGGAGVGGLGQAQGLLGGAGRAGIAGQVGNHRARRQGDRGDGSLDGEIPVIARGVPVELVVVGEEPAHAAHGIADGVGVPAIVEEDVGIADANALDGRGQVLDGEGLAAAVPQHRDDGQVRAEARVVVVDEGGGNVAIDAAPDLVALGGDGDGLDDLHRAVGAQRHGGVEAVDDLFSRCRSRDKQRGKDEEDAEKAPGPLPQPRSDGGESKGRGCVDRSAHLAHPPGAAPRT